MSNIQMDFLDQNGLTRYDHKIKEKILEVKTTIPSISVNVATETLIITLNSSDQQSE